MRGLSLFFVLPITVYASACSSTPPSGERDATEADDLAAMVPGVDETALDRTADPCQDFYQFACGGYIASLPKDTQSDVRGFTELQTERTAALAQVLGEAQSSPSSEAEAKAGALYASCLAPSADKFAAFAQGFKKAYIDAIDTTGFLAKTTATLHRRGIAAFFGFYPGPDSVRRGRHGTADAVPDGFDQSTDYTDASAVSARTAALVTAVKAAEPAMADADAQALVASAVKVETALAGAAAAAGRSTPSPIGRAGLGAATPTFEWDGYFAALGSAKLQDFQVDGLKYFAALDGILKATSLDDARAYLAVRWYEGAAPDAGVTDARRQKFCTSMTAFSMADAFETRFLELAGVDATAQRRARVLFKAITDAMGQQLKEETFLDDSTRVEAETKVAKMRGAIGASKRLDDFADLTVDKDAAFAANWAAVSEHGFGVSLAQIGHAIPLLHVDFPAEFVNASYDGSLNKINVPGGILGGYFFSGKAKKVANFAAIGMVLGHETTHGFDNDGRHMDASGLERDWWTPEVATAFEARAKCMADEYSAFTMDGVADPATGVIPAHVNGEQTLPENIADNGGIKIAYRASGVDTKATPLVSGFTPPQQFFLGFAQIWCAKIAPEIASQKLASDVHSPPKARVNVTLQNFDAFARAFKCGGGAAMAPANRCAVW